MAASNKPTSNLFLTRSDLENVRKWEYKVNITHTDAHTLMITLLKVSDGSLTTLLLNPLWIWLAKFIPASIAPNVITLSGFVCQLLAFWVSDPSIVQWIGGKTSAISAAVFTYSYMTLDALDGKHARATKQSGSFHCVGVFSFCDHVLSQVLLVKYLITHVITSVVPFLQ